MLKTKIEENVGVQCDRSLRLLSMIHCFLVVLVPPMAVRTKFNGLRDNSLMGQFQRLSSCITSYTWTGNETMDPWAQTFKRPLHLLHMKHQTTCCDSHQNCPINGGLWYLFLVVLCLFIVFLHSFPLIPWEDRYCVVAVRKRTKPCDFRLVIVDRT